MGAIVGDSGTLPIGGGVLLRGRFAGDCKKEEEMNREPTKGIEKVKENVKKKKKANVERAD